MFTLGSALYRWNDDSASFSAEKLGSSPSLLRADVCEQTSNATVNLSSNHGVSNSLADIVENIKRIQGYVVGLEKNEFEKDDLKRDAVERCLQRISEAAVRLGEQAIVLMPQHPWDDVRGLGNHLRHAYHRVSVDVIWDTICRDLPPLLADAECCLKGLGN